MQLEELLPRSRCGDPDSRRGGRVGLIISTRTFPGSAGFYSPAAAATAAVVAEAGAGNNVRVLEGRQRQ